MEINIQSLTLALTLFLTLWQIGKSALRVIAPMTKTAADDQALAAMESAEAQAKKIEENEWVKSYGPGFWAQVEAVSKTEIPALKGVGKLAYYLGLAHQAWIAAHGSGLSASAVKQLEQIAAGMSASAKVASANPQPAPASR